MASISDPEHSITVLLVDDQRIVADAIQGMLSDQPDIKFHYCSDPSKAIQTAEEIKPTVILQDLIMPEIDGLMLVSYFKANNATKEIPLIVLSSKEDPVVKAEAFRMGANDYMVKLPDRVEMIARIRYHSEAFLRLYERNVAYRKLEESQSALHAELAEAASYVISLLPKPITTGPVHADWKFVPSAQLGGDALGFQWIDNDHFVFYILDVCGHGVGAALLSISVLNMLKSQAQLHPEYLDPVRVLSDLNASFPMEQNNDMFFTIWYGVYNRLTRKVVYSCGGHPPAIMVDTDSKGNKKITELRVEGTVVGATPKVNFNSGSFVAEKGSRLYLYSDGIYEIAKEDGSMMSLNDFIHLFNEPAHGTKPEMDRLLDFAAEAGGNVPFIDDVTLLELTFD